MSGGVPLAYDFKSASQSDLSSDFLSCFVKRAHSPLLTSRSCSDCVSCSSSADSLVPVAALAAGVPEDNDAGAFMAGQTDSVAMKYGLDMKRWSRQLYDSGSRR